MVLGRAGLPSISERLDYLATVSFDRWMSRHLKECDVFHSLSQFATASQITARQRYRALTVCDRGSTHIVHQARILAEEYDLLNIPFRGIDERLVRRELTEYENADLIFVPSTFVLKTFVAQGIPEHKIRLNPFGVDLSVFHPVPKTDDVFRVMYVGALSVRKGIVYLLEALAELKLPRFELVLIGSRLKEMRSVLARYEGRFRYVGLVPNTELFKYYSTSSVFVIASIEEGLAMVQGQALACGLPVIATVNTGAEDLFTDGVEGFIVPIRDPEAIRDRILRLYRDPELRREMSRAALRRVTSMRGWADYGERAVAYYKTELTRRDEMSSASVD
jgi:alpha-maltose-1-phosphate synthase